MINYSKEKILITGASGFLGSNLIKSLLEKKARIFAISKGKHHISQVETAQIDLANFKEVKTFIDRVKPTIVFHLGALVVLSRDFKIAQECVSSNIMGTLNLLEAAKDLKLKRFLFLSTEEIYGDNKPPYIENQLPMPPSPYAVSKVAGENFCQLYHLLYNLPTTVFRINTIYGYFQPSSRFIPTLIIKALKNQPIDFNSGKNSRDYLFVDDLIEAIILSADDKKKLSGQIINIGSGESISGEKLIKKIIKLARSTSKINFNAFPDRECEAPKWKIDNGKAKKILNWQQKHSLDQGLIKTIAYYNGVENDGK